MKDTKFIELLNLYVDQQIDPADAALLEQEIARNSSRRDTYRDYCQMHRACGMLFEQSLPQAGVGEKLAAASAAADRKVIDFPESASRGNGGWYAAGLGLVAACAAFAFVLLRDNGSKPQTLAVNPAPQALQPQVVQMPITQPVPAQENRPSAALIKHNEALAIGSSKEVPESLKWLTQIELTPLAPVNLANLSFDSRPIQAAPNSLRSAAPADATESNAIKYDVGR